MLQVTAISESSAGGPVALTTTLPPNVGPHLSDEGWVKFETSKGVRLLERMDARTHSVGQSQSCMVSKLPAAAVAAATDGGGGSGTNDSEGGSGGGSVHPRPASPVLVRGFSDTHTVSVLHMIRHVETMHD